jgi:hypothetical protein
MGHQQSEIQAQIDRQGPNPTYPTQQKAVILNADTTLNDYVDLTFDTDAVAAMVSGSINTRIESVISTGTQLASIMAYTASLLSVKLHSGSLANYANDAAAATGGVPVGNLYHTAGAVKVRLT